MKKQAIFIFILILVLTIFFFVGIKTQNENKKNIAVKNNIENVENQNIISINEIIETNTSEEKTTPNTKLVLRRYYSDCDHIIENTEVLPEEDVNLTENEIQEKYKEWEIEEFSRENVVLYKEIEGYCKEHYFITEENGYIVIYDLDRNENKTLREATDLSVEYLTETDRIALENGIVVYGNENLNKLIEDFEI